MQASSVGEVRVRLCWTREFLRPSVFWKPAHVLHTAFAWRSFDVMELRSTPGDKNEDLERAKSRALAFRARLVNLRPISVMICMNEDRRHLCILLS